jgi:hypothetical protein
MSERVHTVPTVAYGRRFRLGAVVAATVLAGIVAWLIFRGDDNQSKSPVRAGASAASVSQLQAVPDKVGHDLYWAGTQRGFTYELTETNKGNIFLRYLPAGVELNDPRPDFLTVGTYPRQGAYAILQKFSKQPGSVSRQLDGGGIAAYSRDRPNSVYVAYSGSDLQIEVYDPSPSGALRLVTSGRIKPIQ